MNLHIVSLCAADVDCAIHFVHSGSDPAQYGLAFSPRDAKKARVSLWREPRPTLLCGVGATDSVTAESLRVCAATALRQARAEGFRSVAVHCPDFVPGTMAARACSEGAVLGLYVFDKYKGGTGDPEEEGPAAALPQDVYMIVPDEAAAQAAAWGEHLATGACLARDLANEPPNVLRPSSFAEFVAAHFAGTDVAVEVFDRDELERRQMVGLLTVGKGSPHEPRMILMRLVTDPSLPKVALLGKGITFDTGGISLKTGRDLSNMRFDMAGAAAVVGAMDTLLRSKTACNVLAMVVAAENNPDGGSMLPGELIAYPNGTSVQIANTDAEGRLVLADGLLHAKREGAVTVVDIATLTGAAAAALGPRYAAVFGTDAATQAVLSAGSDTGDYAWRLPLVDEYEDRLKSTYADICNIGKGAAGAITAALFLRHFVAPGMEWAHIDMAGQMEQESTSGYLPAGATGFGARLLASFVASGAVVPTR